MRSLASDFCELLSMTLELWEVRFSALLLAAHSGQQRASRTEQNQLRLDSLDNGSFGYGQLVLHPFYGALWALQIQPVRDNSTFNLCAAVWRAGSVAARWEYRSNPLVHREKVRACATHHT